MLVVLKYTLAGQPCKSPGPALSTRAAQGTGVERVGETEGEEIDWDKGEVGGKKETVEGRIG